MEQSIKAAKNAKELTPNTTNSFSTGYIPPKVLSYVIAYDGPANMQTVYSWIPIIHKTLGITIADLPQGDNERFNTPSPSIDGVFILNKGFIYFDNVPLGFANTAERSAHPKMKWLYSDSPNGNLLLFFMLIQTATQNLEGKWLNSAPYLQSFSVPTINLGMA